MNKEIKAKYLIDEIVRKALDKLNKDITNKDVDSILNKAVEDIKKLIQLFQKVSKFYREIVTMDRDSR